MKLKTARFTDPSMTLIRYEELVDNEEIKVEHETYDTSSERCQAILKQFSVEQLTENYKKFEEDEAKFLNALEHLKNQELGPAEVVEVQSEAEPLFNTISNLTTENDSEGLFKLKLDIFETPSMKSTEDKELKSKIRRADSAIKVIALYYEHLKSFD